MRFQQINKVLISNKKTLLLSMEGSVTKIYLYKELGEIPYWISKLYSYEAIIDGFADNDDTLISFRTVKLRRYQQQAELLINLKKVLYVFKTAHNVDILYLIHSSPQSYLRALAYKLGGGKGAIYLKMDAEYSPTRKFMRWGKIWPITVLYKLCMVLPDLYTIETVKAYELMKSSCYMDLFDKNKLYLLRNGFDPEILLENGIARKPVHEKEKILLTVGRIGTYQKNTELLLDILSNVDLKNWKMYIVGSIEYEFQPKIDHFFAKYPNLKENVFFTGMISQKDMYTLYNRARIFLLTSRNESFAFVLAEAAYMYNYIISTNVGIAEELIDYAGGYIVPEQKKEWFIEELQRIISLSNQELNALVPENNREELTWEWIIKNNEGIQKLL